MNATNPYNHHAYNPNGAIGYLITFHTYGTWLHGDENGSIGRKNHNIPGSPMMISNLALNEYEKEQLKIPPVTLTICQRESIDSTIREVSEFKRWILHALNVRTEHIHLVISALKNPELIMNSFKSWCTRRMRESGIWESKHTPWSRHGSTRYLWNEKELKEACNYVLYGQNLPPP